MIEPDEEYYLEQMRGWCQRLHSKKWWHIAVIEKIMICHYVDKALEARNAASEQFMQSNKLH